jgi:hypothetical protein
VPYELAVPYTAAQAKELSIKQSYDRLYIAHPNHPPGMITRTGAETFTYLPIPLENGPFQDFNTNKATTITWSGSRWSGGGTATIVANGEIFDAGHVGAPFIFEVESFSDIPAWEPSRRTDTLATRRGQAPERRQGLRVRRKGRTAGSEYTGTIEPTHTSGANGTARSRSSLGTDRRRRRRPVEISL